MRKPTEPIPHQKSSFRQLLRMRNFRLLWGAGALSAIGDQFDLIAFPWLVLLITGDPLAVGAVIAVGGIPTVFFMLLGGSLADRFSPRAIMQVSNILRIGLSAGLATLILTGFTELWLIYLFALLKGISDSFYYPAQLAIVPDVVPSERLRQSNAIIQTTADLGGFVGPMFAGGLIAFLGTGDASGGFSFTGFANQQEVAGADLTGVGLAFAAVGPGHLRIVVATGPGTPRAAQQRIGGSRDERCRHPQVHWRRHQVRPRRRGDVHHVPADRRD